MSESDEFQVHLTNGNLNNDDEETRFVLLWAVVQDLDVRDEAVRKHVRLKVWGPKKPPIMVKRNLPFSSSYKPFFPQAVCPHLEMSRWEFSVWSFR